MGIRNREGNNPKRRVAFDDCLSKEQAEILFKKLSYVGASFHKLHPGNYNFVPPTNPRPSKSVCDDKRSVLLEEAGDLMRVGIARGMMSQFGENGLPKYIWAVDDAGEVYEAKTKPSHETQFHGYRLGDDERDMRELIRKLWGKRCPN
jgi:hypothetical protein